jgi:hypothetical protein
MRSLLLNDKTLARELMITGLLLSGNLLLLLASWFVQIPFIEYILVGGGLKMDMNDARGKKERWGNRPCRHVVKVMETDKGIPTGNYVLFFAD